MGIVRMILAFLRTFVASRANLAAENVLLRQQLIVLERSVPAGACQAIEPRPEERIVLAFSWGSGGVIDVA